VRGGHLPISEGEAICEVAEHPDLSVHRLHHDRTDRRVKIGPEQIAAETDADREHDQIESHRVVARWPGWARVRLPRNHAHPLDCLTVANPVAAISRLPRA